MHAVQCWDRSTDHWNVWFGLVGNCKRPTLCGDRRWYVRGACAGLLWERLTDWLVTEAPREVSSPHSLLLPLCRRSPQYAHPFICAKTYDKAPWIGVKMSFSKLQCLCLIWKSWLGLGFHAQIQILKWNIFGFDLLLAWLRFYASSDSWSLRSNPNVTKFKILV